MRQTTKQGLEALQDAPLILNSAGESFSPTSLQNNSNVNSPVDGSKPLLHSGSGCNSGNRDGVSVHNVFVLSNDGKPLTPTTNARARKLMKAKQAKPVWNKFGQFGIQMLVETRKETPKTVLGVDFGTKFEGYAVVSGKENNLAVMWKLPDKKKLVRKMEERKLLRQSRRQRNCRRREQKVSNRKNAGFIAPSQMMVINSRLKCIRELFNCYPFDTVALETVHFNHRDNKHGAKFSTMEIGKTRIHEWIMQRAHLQLFNGLDTRDCRTKYGYKKSSAKNVETFNSHCSDALAIATGIYAREHIQSGTFLVVDDKYKCVRRKLHDTQPSKGGIRAKFSTGNFKGIRKGTVCNFGQITGGKYDKIVRTRNWKNVELSRTSNNIAWLSHKFKTNELNVELKFRR